MNNIEKFSRRRVRELLRSAPAVPQFPDDGFQGWRKSPVDPLAVLRAYPPLHLRPEFALRAYQFCEEGNGNAVVYAVPKDVPFPEPEECAKRRDRFLRPPDLPGALADIMLAIDGDGSAFSYYCASMFARTIGEFGAMWHGCSWSTHTILDANPFTAICPRAVHTKDLARWQWIEPAPIEWRPSVTVTAPVRVTFFTYTGLESERITRFTDQYQPGSYAFQTQETVVAQGPSGYIF